MNFIFMIILIIIILLCFNIYIKNIHSCFYTLILLFLFICHELYFYNTKENFQTTQTMSHEYNQFEQTPTIKKQQCIFEKQRKLLDPNQPINSICYQLKDIQTCSNNKACLYDNELRKCVDNDLCNNISNTEIKCHFMDDEMNCHNLRNVDNCNFNITDCGTKSKCETHYSTDVYNKSNNTNMVDCCNFNTLKTIIKQFYGSFPEPIILESENDIHNIIDNNNRQDDIKYYGIRKLDNKIYLYLFKNNDYSEIIKDSRTLSYNCLNNDNKYLGTFNSIIMYSINKQCINKKKCRWNKTDNMCYKNMNNGDDRNETIKELNYAATTATTATTATA